MGATRPGEPPAGVVPAAGQTFEWLTPLARPSYAGCALDIRNDSQNTSSAVSFALLSSGNADCGATARWRFAPHRTHPDRLDARLSYPVAPSQRVQVMFHGNAGEVTFLQKTFRPRSLTVALDEPLALPAGQPPICPFRRGDTVTFSGGELKVSQMSLSRGSLFVNLSARDHFTATSGTCTVTMWWVHLKRFLLYFFGTSIPGLVAVNLRRLQRLFRLWTARHRRQPVSAPSGPPQEGD